MDAALHASIVRMRDHGRSWSEIRDRTGVPIADAREIVAEAKAERRSALARTEVRERANGLLDVCAHCTHPRKEHVGRADGDDCATCGPLRTAWTVWTDTETLHFAHPTLSAPKPPRPADFVGDWSAFPDEIGCPGFETVDAFKARLDASRLPRSGRHLNDLVGEAFAFGVPISPRATGRSGQRLEMPGLKHRVRRARRRARKNEAKVSS